MLRIELVPTLDHCVQSTAEDEYEKSLRAYLGSDVPDDRLQERTELILAFLQSADFPALRRESEKYLAEGKLVKFVVYLEGGQPKYEMKVM